MQEGRLTPWEQRRQVYAEGPEAKHIAERALLASCHPAEERLRIVGGLVPGWCSRRANRRQARCDSHDCDALCCRCWTEALQTATLASPRRIAAVGLQKCK